jgi:hypothetical protein
MTTNQKSQKPYAVYVVEGEGDKAYWTKIGGAWRHDDGEGFNIQLRCLPPNGRPVVREPKIDGGGAMSLGRTDTSIEGCAHERPGLCDCVGDLRHGATLALTPHSQVILHKSSISTEHS